MFSYVFLNYFLLRWRKFFYTVSCGEKCDVKKIVKLGELLTK